MSRFGRIKRMLHGSARRASIISVKDATRETQAGHLWLSVQVFSFEAGARRRGMGTFWRRCKNIKNFLVLATGIYRRP